MEIPKYPEEYFSFIKAVKIEDSTIRLKIIEGINILKSRLRESKADKDFTNFSTGDTLIVIWAYKNNNGRGDRYYFTINVCKGREEASIWDIDINE